MVMSSRDETLPAGWVVRIATKSLSGERPMTMMCAAVCSSPVEAEELVRSRDHSTPDEEIAAVGQLSRATIEALGLVQGQVSIL
jgi:hypothetical protein